MGSSDEGKSCKPEKSTSPVPDQGSIHVYPDWAAMQAYYGPRVSVPPYFNTAFARGHAPHPYMWGPPQHMIPPFGAPYAAMYAHGGVYAHTGVPLGSHAQASGVPVGPTVSKATGATSVSVGTLRSKEQGLMSKLISVRNGNADSGEVGLSESTGTEGSSDGSNAAGAGGNNKKRMRGTSPTNVGTGVSPALDLSNPNASAAAVPQLGPTVPREAWLQNEHELKRERRKQSNRESARRSRLRKQAETEELARRVQSLSAENMTLKTEINKLTENSKKLKFENAALMEKLQNQEQGQSEEISLAKIDDEKLLQPMATANLITRVETSGKNDEEDESYETRAKLHQLLDATCRTDAMAAR